MMQFNNESIVQLEKDVHYYFSLLCLECCGDGERQRLHEQLYSLKETIIKIATGSTNHAADCIKIVGKWK